MKKQFTLKEYPDTEYLNIIHTHPNIWDQHRAFIKKYASSHNGECVSITYFKPFIYGRYFPKDSSMMSCVTMWNKLRSTLFSNTDIDIDIVACHHNILLSLLDNPLYETTKLKYYCEYREKELKTFSMSFDADVVQDYNSNNRDNKESRDIAKSLFTILLYGGTIKTWADTYNFKDADYKITPFIHEFITELQENINIIMIDKRFKDILSAVRTEKINLAKKKYGKKFDINTFKLNNNKVLAIILQEYESIVIEEIMRHFANDDFVITSYNYDGFQVRKCDDIQKKLKEINYYAQNLGFSHNKKDVFQFKNITFVEKPFSKPLDLSKLIILNSEYYNPKIMSSTYEYAIKQAYFEKFHFKCRYPLQYFAKSCDTEGNPIDIFIKSSNFTETYQELKVFKDIKGNQTLVPFINEWVVDEKLRSYNQVAYIPVASKCPKDIYNLWSPFPILRVPLNDAVDTSFIYDYINTLFSDNPVVVHYVLNLNY